MQTVESAATSRKQIPALFKSKVFASAVGERNADIGGGKWDDATLYLADRHKCTNYVIDPFNRHPEHNRQAILLARGCETATLCNVLCVIDCIDARRAAINEACCLVDVNHGRVFISSYEGDKSGEGKRTRCGWQANRKTADWIGEVLSCPSVGAVKQTGKILTVIPRWCE